MDLPEAKGALILTPLCTSALFYTYFSYLKLHKKERSQKKNLRSHLGDSNSEPLAQKPTLLILALSSCLHGGRLCFKMC